MNLFHTSASAINSIDTNGRFGEFLFFSIRPYSMATCAVTTYEIEIDENEIIEARSIFYHEDAAKLHALVAEFCARFDVDTDTAEEIIAERQQLDSLDADDSWDVQKFTARAAKILGFRGVRVSDEQGPAYMIDMLGRDNELVAVGGN